MPFARPRRAAAGLFVAALALTPAAASAAPSISGADGDVWNAQTAPASYVITGTADGAVVSWQVRAAGRALPRFSGSGASPATVTLQGAPDGRLSLIATQRRPADPGTTTRAFSIDTQPPTTTVTRPAAGAVYERGTRITAAFSCGGGAVSCEGTIEDGAALDTSTTGTRIFTVRATDGAGNTAAQNVEYRVAAAPAPAPSPAAPPTAAPAGSPAPPSPSIRLAPPSPGAPEDTVPAVSNADRLRPSAGAAVTERRPVLRWTRVSAARLYNVQIYRLRGTQATKVLSAFPTTNRFRVPAGRLGFDERYVWRVWPLIREAYPASPHGLSWFDVRRPVRLTPAQLLVNQRISQAALRRTAAISDWLDAGLVTGDLRDGGLGREDFGADVTLSGQGQAIANGVAAPRPLITAAASRARAPRLRVSARQLLVNQRISQAAVRRANALAQRIEGGLTGGDLREGAVSAVKLAPGLSIAAARPTGPAPPASSTTVAAATRSGAARVEMSDRQALINQRISQAAVRRANALREVIEGGLTGANFRTGTISAAAVSPDQRS